MDLNLDWYPHLKDEISDVFNIKVSLTDLAKELEKDLVIIEENDNAYKLCFKKDYIPGFQSRLQINTDLVNTEKQSKSRLASDDEIDQELFTGNIMNKEYPYTVRNRAQSDVKMEDFADVKI